MAGHLDVKALIGLFLVSAALIAVVLNFKTFSVVETCVCPECPQLHEFLFHDVDLNEDETPENPETKPTPGSVATEGLTTQTPTATPTPSMPPTAPFFQADSACPPKDDDDCPPRNIYIDAGANRANTLDLYRRIDGIPHEGIPWEVYAFEASPILSHFTQMAADQRNKVPGAKGAPRWKVIPGLKRCISEMLRVRMYNPDCHTLFIKYDAVVKASVSSKSTYPKWVQRVAKQEVPLPPLQCVSPSKRTFVNVIPYAIGARDGMLNMTWSPQHYFNGGSNVKGMQLYDKSIAAGLEEFQVPVINFFDFMRQTLRPKDFVFLKLDIEGSEYEIIRGILSFGLLGLIDEIEVEWHSRFKEVRPMNNVDAVLRWILENAGIIFHDHT